jgi:hypothetical protein
MCAGGKEVAWMGLKGQGATGHAALLRLAFKQRQHGLVATVHTVKVADRQCACGCHVGVLETAKNFH